MNIKWLLFVLAVLVTSIIVFLVHMLIYDIRGYLIGVILGWSMWVLGRAFEFYDIKQRNESRR